MIIAFVFHLISYSNTHRYGTVCKRYNCGYAHPEDHVGSCPEGHDCRKRFTASGCPQIHPEDMRRKCEYGDSCDKEGCRFSHPRNHIPGAGPQYQQHQHFHSMRV